MDEKAVAYTMETKMKMSLSKDKKTHTTIMDGHDYVVVFKEIEPVNVPADQSWCNGCGRLFKESLDKKVYKCPQCKQVSE